MTATKAIAATLACAALAACGNAQSDTVQAVDAPVANYEAPDPALSNDTELAAADVYDADADALDDDTVEGTYMVTPQERTEVMGALETYESDDDAYQHPTDYRPERK